MFDSGYRSSKGHGKGGNRTQSKRDHLWTYTLQQRELKAAERGDRPPNLPKQGKHRAHGKRRRRRW